MTDDNTARFIKEHEKEDVRKLALQSKRYADVDMQFVLRQIAGKQIACDKIPYWYRHEKIIYPEHISLEQCSSEKTAEYKASLCKGGELVDLTGGLGVDFSFMSSRFAKATYVENQEALVVLAKSNFESLDLKNTNIINDNAEHYLMQMDAVNTIYIDPSRRSRSGSKTVLIEDCSPNLIELEQTLNDKCSQLIIKLSPMLDITQALNKLTIITDVHIVSCNNECKELLLVKNNDNRDADVLFYCVNILNNGTSEKYSFVRSKEEYAQVIYGDRLKKYLYEPNASVMKSGAYKCISEDFRVDKLHVNSHLYTSDEIIENFPGRKFIVKDVIPFGKKEMKDALHNIDKANITVRNFPLSVEEIRKRTGLKDGGDNYIFATTISDSKKVLILCSKI